jgi:hypothetical protein
LLRFRPNLNEAALEDRVLPVNYSLLPSGTTASVLRPGFASGPGAVGAYTTGMSSNGAFGASIQVISNGPGGGGSGAGLVIIYPAIGQRYFGSAYLYGFNFGLSAGQTTGPSIGSSFGTGAATAYGGERGVSPAGSPSGPAATGINVTTPSGAAATAVRANDSPSTSTPSAPAPPPPLRPLDLQPPTPIGQDSLIRPQASLTADGPTVLDA